MVNAVSESYMRLKYDLKYDCVTPLLRQLHWLKVPWWIDYKLVVLVFKCLTLQMNSITLQSQSFESVCSPHCRIHCLFVTLDYQPTVVTKLFQSLQPGVSSQC